MMGREACSHAIVMSEALCQALWGSLRLDQEVWWQRYLVAASHPETLLPETVALYLASGAVPRAGSIHLSCSLWLSRGRGPLLAWQKLLKASARDLGRTTTLAGWSPGLGGRRRKDTLSCCLADPFKFYFSLIQTPRKGHLNVLLGEFFTKWTQPASEYC
jgi:hypothetical protein